MFAKKKAMEMSFKSGIPTYRIYSDNINFNDFFHLNIYV